MKPLHQILLAGMSIVAATGSTPVMSAPAADSVYLTDAQQSHVEDATSKGIGQVNMITCFMGNTGADKLVNQPSFAAMLNKTKCDKNSQASASNSGAAGSAGAAPEYMRAKVFSTRASNSDPMIARIWVEDSDGNGGSSTIFLKLAASEAPSPANPWGTFRLDYCGRALVNTSSWRPAACRAISMPAPAA